ncbi:MAG: glutathione S-transferase [Rickettsiales bacterium]|nr:glutathione S-transferase [Rickettsiales bacterium]
MMIKVYDLCGAQDRRFSPFCWRIRMALAHKGLEAEFEPMRFTEKDKIAFAHSETVPVLVDGNVAMNESWEIANYLEETYPDRPSLFGGEASRAVTGFINAWTNSTLHPALIMCVLTDIYERIDPIDVHYFRESREKRFGKTLEEIGKGQSAALEQCDRTLTPLRTILKSEQWIAGDAPAYADYLIFAAFQWCRIMSPAAIIKAGDPIFEWRERMLDLFDGLGHNFESAASFP